MLDAFIKEHQLPAAFQQTARQFFVPIVNALHQQVQVSSAPFFLAINGCQGSGKSTLAAFLANCLQHMYSYKVAVLSLDDFYLPQSQRAALANNIHPLLKTRGVPGTHDISLLTDTLQSLAKRQVTKLPRFDKAIDDPLAQSKWPSITSADLVIFEGWCWGVTPQDEQSLAPACNTLEQQHDQQGIWRHYVNQQLKQHYVPLYQYMNTWLMLAAPSFACVNAWRWQQEQQLATKNQHNSTRKQIMSKSQVAQFIQYFQRLTEHGLQTLPASCQYLLSLDCDRNITHFRSKPNAA